MKKKGVLELIGNYRNGHLPLIVPVTLLNHFVRKYSQSYLSQQTYLNPHPLELALRNHVETPGSGPPVTAAFLTNNCSVPESASLPVPILTQL